MDKSNDREHLAVLLAVQFDEDATEVIEFYSTGLCHSWAEPVHGTI